MKIPCKNCLIIPICKHKQYCSLTSDCSKVIDYIFSDGNRYFSQMRRIKKVMNLIQPYRWTVEGSGNYLVLRDGLSSYKVPPHELRDM